MRTYGHLLAGMLIAACLLALWALLVNSAPTTLESLVKHDAEPTEFEKRIRSFDQHKPKLDAIATEVERLGEHPWAGVYSVGNRRGYRLTVSVAPESGFFYMNREPWGLDWWNHGTVRETDRGSLAVELALSEDPDDPRRVASEWVPVRWNGRQYLIAAHQMPHFCDDVNSAGDKPWMFASGREKHILNYPMRDGYVPKTPDGKPVVPEHWRPLLRDTPVTGFVTKIKERREVVVGPGGQLAVDLVAEIDIGHEQGVIEDMLIHVDDRAFFYYPCRVTEVRDRSATIEVRANLGAELKQGTKVSTHMRELPNQRENDP